MVSIDRKLLFIDTNVLIDYVQTRNTHYESAERIFTLAETKKIIIGISMISFTTLFYLCRKTHAIETIQHISKNIRSISEILSATEDNLISAEKSNFLDLEDAIQNHIAETNGCTTIITRNTKDFKKSNLAVLTPEEFLATL